MATDVADDATALALIELAWIFEVATAKVAPTSVEFFDLLLIDFEKLSCCHDDLCTHKTCPLVCVCQDSIDNRMM